MAKTKYTPDLVIERLKSLLQAGRACDDALLGFARHRERIIQQENEEGLFDKTQRSDEHELLSGIYELCLRHEYDKIEKLIATVKEVTWKHRLSMDYEK